MYDLKTILLAKRFRRNLDITHLTIADIAMLEIIKNKTSGNPVRNATISNGIATFGGVVASQPLASLKLNIPVTQTGSGTPSPDNVREFIGFSGVNISRTGKNLFNGTNVLNASIHGITNLITVTTTPYELGLIYAPCKPNTTYTVSKLVGERFAIGYTTETPDVGVLVNGKIVNRTASSITITTGADAKYIVAFVFNSAYDVVTEEQMINSIQVELGNTATAYEPYTGNTYRITFGQTVYSAILDVLNGKLYLIDEIKTIDENSGVTVSATNNNVYICDDVFNIDEDTESVNCNVYQRAENRSSITGVVNNNPDLSFCCKLGTNPTRLLIKDTRFSSTEDYNTWLANNPVKIAVKLAEPIEIDLTPTIINTLIGENVIFADVANVTECKYTRK